MWKYLMMIALVVGLAAVAATAQAQTCHEMAKAYTTEVCIPVNGPFTCDERDMTCYKAVAGELNDVGRCSNFLRECRGLECDKSAYIVQECCCFIPGGVPDKEM